MPEDLPMAVLVLVWLLIGLIVLGYLIMDHSLLGAGLFAALFYGLPVFWYQRRRRQAGDGE